MVSIPGLSKFYFHHVLECSWLTMESVYPDVFPQTAAAQKKIGLSLRLAYCADVSKGLFVPLSDVSGRMRGGVKRCKDVGAHLLSWPKQALFLPHY